MRLKIIIKVDDEEIGRTEKRVTRTFADYGKECLQGLADAIIEAIPNEVFPPFDVLEIYKDGKSVGHAEKF